MLGGRRCCDWGLGEGRRADQMLYQLDHGCALFQVLGRDKL